ncbi:MAG: PAS domain-containing protein [Betaproteobacteria bacterium]|nr:PAS domain-containing protein [Betaproteobacteria bacterium]
MPLRLLVIEDRLSDFELIEQQLERQGVAATCRRVDSADDLEGALDDGAWDAVLTDYNLPGMKFQETVSRLRTRRPELPIVLVSGYMGEDQAAMLLEAGIADFVLKYRPARLGAAIRRAIANAQAQHARCQAEIALHDSAQRLQEALGEVQATNERLEQEVAARTAQLRRQTNYLLALIDNVPFRVWLKDTEGRFLAVNRAQAAAHGRTPQDIVGRTDFDLVDAETAREWLAADREVMRNRRPAKHDIALNGADRMGWVESYKAPVFDAAGNVLGTIGYARDMTDLEATDPVGERARDPRRPQR